MANMVKGLLKKLPQPVFYNILTSHDVLQAMIWRCLAPPVAEATFRQNYQMLYVVGCGRSGTTIFSHCLGRHRDIAELNEPLHIWCATTAKADIMSPFASLVQGLCRLDRNHADEGARARYRAMVDYQVKRTSPVVCDKLPLNTFRVDYINAVCPDAKFIFLQRSPRAVARSIELCAKRDRVWWGFNDYKWRAIQRYAESRPDLKPVLPHAVDDYYRGLVEWRVGHELAREDLSKLGADRSIEVRYEDFVTDPKAVLERSFAFGGMPTDDDATAFAANEVTFKSAKALKDRSSSEDQRRHAAILGEHVDWGVSPAMAM